MKLLAIDKKRALIGALLCLAVFCCSILFFIPRQRKMFAFERTVKSPSLARFPKDFTVEIDAAKVFAERYVRSYLQHVNEKTCPDLRSSFMLASKKCVSGKVFFSSVAESCIYLYPADENELVVECTMYPAQLTLLTALDTPGTTGRLTMPHDEALLKYDQMKAALTLKGKMTTISDLTLSVRSPKVFSLGQDSLVTLARVQFVLRDERDREIRRAEFEHVGIMTGTNDFSFALEKASDMGRKLAEEETISLFLSSSFFREVLAYNELRPLAEDIQTKHSRATKDPDFDYPFPLFKRDLRNLQERAGGFGLDVRYVDGLLRDPSITPDDGYLFWYYKSRAGFMFQWALANVVLMVVIIVLLLARRLAMHTNWKTASSSGTLVKSSLVVLVNGYILSQKPESLHFKFMVVPGLLFLVCIILSLCVTAKRESVSR